MLVSEESLKEYKRGLLEILFPDLEDGFSFVEEQYILKVKSRKSDSCYSPRMKKAFRIYRSI